MPTTRSPLDSPLSLETAIEWIRAQGTRVEAWPPGEGSPPASASHPVLYLVEPGAPVPEAWGQFEDWIRLPSDSDDLYARADRLVLRASGVERVRLHVDEDDMLHGGPHVVALSPLEARLIRALLAETGAVVTRSAIEAQVWPNGGPSDVRALDHRIRHLRVHLQGLPLRIHTVRGHGFLLEVVGAPPAQTDIAAGTAQAP